MRRALAVVVSLASASAPGTAVATPYETFIDVDDQQQLDDLLAAGDITQDTYEELLDLLSNGVDLSTADRAELYALPNLTYEDVDRIIQYREQQKGIIKDPADLAAAGAISEEKLLAISAFIIVRAPDDRLKVRGFVQAMTRWAPSDGDDFLPPFASRGRFNTLKHLRMGYAATLTRLQIGDPVWDPNRGALLADARSTKAKLPKIYAMWETDDVSLIAGTYRVGFGQRLVFDNTSRYTPNGFTYDDQLVFSTDLATECRESGGELPSPCLGEDRYRYVTPDWRWRDGLLGAGAGAKHIPAGAGWLQLYGWASSARRSLYQYELYVPSEACPDPSDDTNPACAAPSVFVRPDGNVLAQTTRHSFSTLQNVFRENLAGANVAFFADRRSSVGLTAYVASETDLVDGIDLDFQEWSRLPTGKRFGAAGANFTFGRGILDVSGEAGFSYDESPDPRGPVEGGGGPAAILRVTATQKREELEVVARYYGIDHENPFARPIAQADELDGSRARDEVGGRVRYTRSDKLYSLRTSLDLWTPLSTMRDASILGEERMQPKLDAFARSDVRTSDELWLGLWLRYQDKDLREGGQDQCFEVSTEENEAGETVPCKGRQLTTSVRARYQPDKRLHFSGLLQHQLLDDDAFSETKFRHDLSAWAIALWRPQPDLRVRARLRYLDEATSLLGGKSDYLERSLAAVVDVATRLRGRDSLRVRVDGKFWLDDRASTEDRSPNPELQLWLQYEARL